MLSQVPDVSKGLIAKVIGKAMWDQVVGAGTLGGRGRGRGKCTKAVCADREANTVTFTAHRVCFSQEGKETIW